jgi:hypothetical protein
MHYKNNNRPHGGNQMSRIDSAKKLLERIARQINNFEPTDEDWPERLHDIASRLGKLDGWFIPNGKENVWKTTYISVIDGDESNTVGISTDELRSSIPDELTKPETPAQKYERITGKHGVWMSGTGARYTNDYVAWLESGQPNEWKGE